MPLPLRELPGFKEAWPKKEKIEFGQPAMENILADGFNEALYQASSCEIEVDQEELAKILQKIWAYQRVYKNSSGQFYCRKPNWDELTSSTKGMYINRAAAILCTMQSWLRIRKAK